MSIFSNLISYKSNYFSLLLALIPVSFIAGNMIININILFLILSSIFFFHINVFKLKFFILDKLILLYFLIILGTALINDYYFYSIDLSDELQRGILYTTFKSVLFLKYLLLYLVIRFLVENRIVNLKFFFITCLFSTAFVSIDIFYQLLNGKDIFGFESNNTGRKLSGPFGDELIAGGYIQRFCIFSFFLLPFFYPEISKKYSKYFVPILFIIFFLGIILSGNRMPLLLFLFTIGMIVIFQKQVRKYLLIFLITFTLIFTIIFNLNNKVKNNFFNFYHQVTNIFIVLVNQNDEQKKSPYSKEFSTFYDTWLLNKYIGGGIKNFRYYCHVRPNVNKSSDFICNMHPHNYYLEILTETGLLGFVVVSIIFLNILYLTFYKKYISRTILENKNILAPFIFLFVSEIFPLKSTGSFFTTGNTTYLFLIIGILVGLTRKYNSIENKK